VALPSKQRRRGTHKKKKRRKRHATVPQWRQGALVACCSRCVLTPCAELVPVSQKKKRDASKGFTCNHALVCRGRSGGHSLPRLKGSQQPNHKGRGRMRFCCCCYCCLLVCLLRAGKKKSFCGPSSEFFSSFLKCLNALPHLFPEGALSAPNTILTTTEVHTRFTGAIHLILRVRYTQGIPLS
jgi:hypothetical protein